MGFKYSLKSASVYTSLFYKIEVYFKEFILCELLTFLLNLFPILHVYVSIIFFFFCGTVV
jgi:hypothetical protein